VIEVIIGLASLALTAVGAHYAKKAYDSAKISSFPLKNARNNKVEIKNFTKMGREFEKFISDNVHTRVYLNIRLDPDKVEVSKNQDGDWFMIWQECFEPLLEDEKPSPQKCSGFNVSLSGDPEADAGLHWNRGYYDLTGYFSIKGYGGPHQGSMGAVIRAENIA